jgi:hypothetical protein
VYELLLELFTSNDELLGLLANYPYKQAHNLVAALPGKDVPRSTYTTRAVQQIQAHGLDTEKFFDKLAERFPERSDLIQGAKRDYLDGGSGFLSDGDGETPTSVQWPAPMLFQPDLANRVKEEWPAIVELLGGRSRERILLYEGISGFGKSVIIRQAAVYARKLGISVVHVDFKGGGVDLKTVMGHFFLELSKHLPNFSRNGANKTHLLRKDLRGLRQPVLIIFDSYEDCVENKIIVDWLNQQFLMEVETALALVVIIAGQKVPDCTRAAWRDLARRLPLKPINDIKHWEPWIEQHFPEFRNKGAHLPTVVMVAQGNPALISIACEVISKS